MNRRLLEKLRELGATPLAPPVAESWAELLTAISAEYDASDVRNDALASANEGRRDAEALQRAVLVALSDLYFRLDRDNRFVDFRAGNQKDLALVPEAFLGKRLEDLPFGKELALAFVKTAELARQTASVATHAYTLVIDGQPNHFEVRYAPLEDGQLIALVRNHTQAKRVQDELRLAQFAIDRFSDSAFWLAPDGHFSYVNDAMCRGLGYSREELLTMRLVDVAPELSLESWPRLWSQFKERGSLTIESKHRRKDGSTFAAEIAVDHIEYGGKEFACAIARDITERKQLQESLVLSNRMASLGTLAAAVAHEVNNPLAYLIMNLAHLAKQLEKPHGPDLEQLEGLRTAMHHAQHGAERVRLIVRDLRTFSRGDDARVELVDVRPVLRSAITVAQGELRHRAQLVIRFDEVPMVDASEARLGQVFLNLLVNAAQAIDDGASAANEIRVTAKTNDDGAVVVEIADSGRGIEPSVKAHIFEPFFTTKPAGVGTGLGLSICRNIVRGFGGTIEVDSEPGQGATFRVTLPASHRGRPVVVPPAPIVAQRRARILVIDDEPFIIDAMRRALPDHDVAIRSNGKDGIDACRDQRFDVIFCDLVMPGLGGVEVYEQLATIAPDLQQAIVFMTGGVFTPRALDILGSVKNRLLEKPFSLEAVQHIVEELLRDSR